MSTVPVSKNVSLLMSWQDWLKKAAAGVLPGIYFFSVLPEGKLSKD